MTTSTSSFASPFSANNATAASAAPTAVNLFTFGAAPPTAVAAAAPAPSYNGNITNSTPANPFAVSVGSVSTVCSHSNNPFGGFSATNNVNDNSNTALNAFSGMSAVPGGGSATAAAAAGTDILGTTRRKTTRRRY
uniref:Uncharacterized protein n=1 Tax=Lygus hesperus TaxID=30085 RepID=A0A0A9VUK1_LYGHE